MTISSINQTKYIKIKELGKGSYGTVFLVLRDSDNKKFAYKKFKRDEETIDLGILREISILEIFKGNKHGVMNIQDIIFTTEEIGFIMPLYKMDLRDAIDNNKLNKITKINIVYKLLHIINFIHYNGVIHRDIKPENIMLDENFNPILADFSLAKVFSGLCNEGTHTGSIATVTYRAPEVFYKKKYGFPSDIWSLGVVFYEIFTNKSLDENTDIEALNFINNKINKIRETPLGIMIKGMLNNNPEKRLTAMQCINSKIFKKTNNINIKFVKLNTNTNNTEIDDLINNICQEMEVEKNITKITASHYLNKTTCDPFNAVILAIKMFETDTFDIENDFTNYKEEEANILQQLNFNLYLTC